GDNFAGELGSMPSVTATRTPAPVIAGCSALALGPTYSCALCGSDAQCWGDNRNGNLGRGTDMTIAAYQPAKVALPGTGYIELGAGEPHACALRGDHQLFCWGWGPHGQLGDGGHAVAIPTVIGARH